MGVTDPAQRHEAVRAACSDDVRLGLALVEASPGLVGDDIFAACAFGDIGAATDWLAVHADQVDARGGPLDWPPLLYACFSRVTRVDPRRRAAIADIVEQLVAAGADPNAQFTDEHGHAQTAIYGAAGIANEPRMTASLVGKGARPDDGETLYHTVEFADTSCLALVLAAKPDPARVSYSLRRALDFPNEAVIQLLLAHGADPAFPLRSGLRPQLQQALVVTGAPSIVQALLEHGANPSESWHGMTAYRVAIRFGRDEAAQIIEQRGGDTAGVTDFDRALGACVAGRVPTVILDEAVAAGDANDVLEHEARAGHADTVCAILDLHAAIDTVATRTRTLHGACWTGRGDVVSLLVDRGVDLAWKNEFGGTALGATRHGSQFCHDTDGGTTSKLSEEVPPRDYAAIVKLLTSKGAPG